MLTQKIKDKIAEILKSNPNLVSVGLGQKVSGGQVTGESAIVCGVLQKKPIEDLSPEELLPSAVVVDSQTIKLDVVEQGQPVLFTTCSDCGGWNGPNSGQNTNRQYTRPLRGGVTMAATNKYPAVGTFGTIVKDTATGALLGLTNNHVSIEDASYTSSRQIGTINSVIENDYDPTNFIYQGTETTPGGPISPSNQIGRSVRYSPSSTTLPNQIDAALFSIESEGDIDTTISYAPIGLESIMSSNPPFASTSELDAMDISNPDVYSSGRTSGARGKGICGNLRVNQVGVSFNIAAMIQGVPQLINYNNCVSVIRPDDDDSFSQQPGCFNPGLQGDSGSAVYIVGSDNITKLAGLLFAGTCVIGSMPVDQQSNPCCDGQVGQTSCSTIFYFCRIDEIASQLNIEWWDNANDPLILVNPSTLEYITESGTSSEKTKICSGRTYWQAGLTDTLNNPC